MATKYEAYVPILYGDYVSSSYPGSLLADGYMLPCRNEIQAALAQEKIGLAIAYATHAPVADDTVPEVLMAYDPTFDTKGNALSIPFEAGHTLDDRRHPVTIDNHIQNFHGNVASSDTITPRHAYGIGLAPERVWNHHTVQDLGNSKRAADAILRAEGTGIVSYGVHEYDRLVSEQGTESFMYKPNGGARGKGVERFDSVTAYREALDTGRLAPDGHIQKRYDTHQPIVGLKGATEEDQALLDRYNSTADERRPRELRMHIIADSEHVETYPILKVGDPNSDVMKTIMMIGLDPSCVPEGSYIHQRSLDLGAASLRAASQRNGEPGSVKHLYMCADWLISQGMEEAADPRIVDANYRWPGLAAKAYEARRALGRSVSRSVHRQLAR